MSEPREANAEAESDGTGAPKAEDVVVHLSDPVGEFGGGDVVLVVAATSLAPLVTAFCTELGQRLGGRAVDWLSRVELRRKRRKSPETADLVVPVGKDVTVIEISENLTAEAKVALLALDVRAAGVRGRRLRWNPAARAWQAVDR
jgi:hypothetical protein